MLSTLTLFAAESSGGSALSLLFLPLMFVGAYFLLIRPQRRRMKEQSNLQGALQEGDEVITTSGMYGFITGFDGDIVWLEIDDNIQIRVARAAVQRKVDTSAQTSESPASGNKRGSTAIDDIADDSEK
ncbi:MAG: preprotein translocase subunit YajC [Ilumatobacteraceae bacterium]